MRRAHHALAPALRRERRRPGSAPRPTRAPRRSSAAAAGRRSAAPASTCRCPAGRPSAGCGHRPRRSRARAWRHAWPFTSRRSGRSRRREASAAGSASRQRQRRVTRQQRAHHVEQVRRGQNAQAAHAAPPARRWPSAAPARGRWRRAPARAASAIASAPRTGRSSPASDSSPANSKRVEPGRVDLAAGREDAQRDRQVEAAGLLGQVGRRQVDGDALVVRELERRWSAARRAPVRAPPSPRCRRGRPG